MPDQMDAVRMAVETAEDRLSFIDRVPMANTGAARSASRDLRVEVLTHLLADLNAVLGRSGAE